MLQRRTIAVAVVIYNEHCGNSPTCQALDQMTDPNLSVLIYDNSTADKGNRQFCEERGWVFLGGTGNLGLTKAYNACIDYVKESKCSEMVCLFDDDTELDESYFMLLRETVYEGGKIFVPLIYSNGKLLSPCILDEGHKSRRFSGELAVQKYSGNQLSAINSGMALDISLFDNYRYDENIFLDGVDHSFLMDMKKRGENIRIFPYKCNHNFSGGGRPSLKSAIIRFEIFIKDYHYILRDNKIAYLKLIGKRALNLSVQYRTMQFLRMIWQ